MAKIAKATVEIRGIRPLLWHHFGPEILSAERQERSGSKGNDPQEWKASVLTTSGRHLYLPPDYAFGCIRDAARYSKKGRLTLRDSVAATLRILDDKVLVDRKLPKEPIPIEPTAPVYLDIRCVKNPNTKGRNVRYRIAASPGWSASFQITWDPTIVSRDEMQKILHDAGQLIGIGDGRAIGFGRFEVMSFKS